MAGEYTRILDPGFQDCAAAAEVGLLRRGDPGGPDIDEVEVRSGQRRAPQVGAAQVRHPDLLGRTVALVVVVVRVEAVPGALGGAAENEAAARRAHVEG